MNNLESSISSSVNPMYNQLTSQKPATGGIDDFEALLDDLSCGVTAQ